MIVSRSTDTIRVTTSAAGSVAVTAFYADLDPSGGVTVDRQRSLITTATTTTVCAAPASGNFRNIKSMSVRNRHASNTNTITVDQFDGSTADDLTYLVILGPGESLHFDDQVGWRALDKNCQLKTTFNATAAAAVNVLNTVVLGADVINNNAVANTIADVTGMSFAVTAGELYWFYFSILYTSAAATTGARFSVNGPGSPTLLAYRSAYPLTATTETINPALNGYDLPAAANASSLVAGNVAAIGGFIRPSANGTLIARFASEILSSAITAKAGSLLQWMRVI